VSLLLARSKAKCVVATLLTLLGLPSQPSAITSRIFAAPAWSNRSGEA